MATSFAAQLRDIAANTTNELDLKAQRAAHSTSLIFEKKIAGSQDFDTIYQICFEGFKDLCLLDPRFSEFERSLFSAQSKTQDRTQLTKEQNKELDSVIEAYLALVGARLLLKPAIKSVEWLVRRFRIHEYNTAFLILTFLPYYATPIFRNILSILPSKIDPSFKFLHPYITGLTNPPQHAIAYSATNNDGFFAALNGYTITACEAVCGYDRLLTFWTEIVAEALTGRIEQARSGRRDIQDQREQDLMLKVLPTLNDAYALRGQKDLLIGCYTVTMILASRLALSQKVTRSLMEAIGSTLSHETSGPAILALCVLLDNNKSVAVPKELASPIITRKEFDEVLVKLNASYSIGDFVVGALETVLLRSSKMDANVKIQSLDRVLKLGVLNAAQLKRVAVSTSEFSSNATGVGLVTPAGVSELLSRHGPPAIGAGNAAVILVPDSQPGQTETDYDIEMEDSNTLDKQDSWEKVKAHLPTRTVDESTFMKPVVSDLFQQLLGAFEVASSDNDLLSQFCALPVLRPESRTDDPLFFSFFIRVAVSNVSPQLRNAAWKAIGDSLQNLLTSSDLQILFPYILVGLSDSHMKVRQQVVTTVSQVRKYFSGLTKDQHIANLCENGFYDGSTQLPRLSTTDSAKIVQRVLVPMLEEFVSDHDQIGRALQTALAGTTGYGHSSDGGSIELKKNLRSLIFEVLLGHIAQTPSYVAKTRLLDILRPVDKVGSVRKTTVLFPVLRSWCALDQSSAQIAAQSEGLKMTEIDSIMLSIISSSQKDAVNLILSCVSPIQISRASLLDAASKRIIELWPQFATDTQVAATTSLLEAALDTNNERRILSRLSRDLIRSLSLPNDALSHILDHALGSIASVNDQPAHKKRRTSQSQTAMIGIASSELPEILRRITFVLELIDGSSAVGDTELISGLFHVLGALQSLKTTIHSELGYLLSLTLGCLLRILEDARASNRSDIDLSNSRVDLVIECARVTDNPQVQNSALLLVAALASVAPEHVLHSVMPIFTFMGSSILKKDDEYSAHVINQAIDQIIPPLIDSLRKQKKDIVSGTSDLLLSFAAAFEHMPAHRRLGLFDILIQRLGATDTLHAMLAMLANRYPNNPDAQAFSASLASRFAVEIQLQCYGRYLDLIVDTLKPNPLYARTLLGLSTEEDGEAFNVAHGLITALSKLYEKSDLKRSMSRVLRKDEARAAVLRKYFSHLLEQTLELTQSVASHDGLSTATNDMLTSLLNLLSLSELVDVIQRLLLRPGDVLRTKALRLLESRLRTTAGKDTATHLTILSLLPTLANLVQDKVDSRLKHAAVACIDRITEKVGRKDLSAILSTAQAIVKPECLTTGDIRLSTMGLLCLSSMVEVLKDTVIPILPSLMSMVLELLDLSLNEGSESAQLHSATFALLSALLSYVPFMLSDAHLRSILTVSSISASSGLGSECQEPRRDALELLARGVDAKKLLPAIQKTWISSIDNGVEAVTEILTIIETMVDSKQKSTIIGISESMLDLLLSAFDLRRTQAQDSDNYDEQEIAKIEQQTNGVAIKMIYKLNDTAFRPLFSRIVDWATTPTDFQKSNTTELQLRQLSFFNFLSLFFSTLKSIVTSYATLIIPTATTILADYNPTATSTSFPLWTGVLSTLKSLFTHDADDFFAIPSHFTALSIPLTTQLQHLTTPSLLSTHLPHLLPCLVSFATSLTSSPPHLKTLNQQICSLRTSDFASVRLSSVRIQAALTKELGEEWLANSGEMMVYIQRMLEDDDEKVELETREWVAEVQEVLGEDVGEMLQS